MCRAGGAAYGPEAQGEWDSDDEGGRRPAQGDPQVLPPKEERQGVRGT